MGDEKTSKLDEMLDMYKTETTVEGKNRRDLKQQKIHDTIDDTARKFLIRKRGADEADKNVPKTYDLESHDEAHEMVLEIAKAVIKHKFPKINVKDLDEYHLFELFDSATGQRGYAHNLVSELADTGKNVLASDDYKQAKNAVAHQLSHQKFYHARNYLTSNKDARGKIESIVDKELAKHGRAVNKSISQSHLVEHLGTAYEGSITDKYVDHYNTHFKKAAKPAK